MYQQSFVSLFLNIWLFWSVFTMMMTGDHGENGFERCAFLESQILLTLLLLASCSLRTRPSLAATCRTNTSADQSQFSFSQRCISVAALAPTCSYLLEEGHISHGQQVLQIKLYNLFIHALKNDGWKRILISNGWHNLSVFSQTVTVEISMIDKAIGEASLGLQQNIRHRYVNEKIMVWVEMLL